MNRPFATLLSVVGIAAVLAEPLAALPRQQPPPERIKVCALLPKEEVKKHLPWIAALDRLAPEEEPFGTSGSSCNYPSVTIQVLPFSQNFLDAARKRGPLETIAGIGDEAYFHNNSNRYAELYVRTGKHLLTLQGNAPNDGKIESVKPGVLSLAKALVAKLR